MSEQVEWLKANRHSRVERHTGGDVLVCWKRESHGEAVPGDGFCHDGTGKEGE